jgi:hypothetical protein
MNLWKNENIFEIQITHPDIVSLYSAFSLSQTPNKQKLNVI